MEMNYEKEVENYMSKVLKEILKDGIFFIIGSILFALSINVFTAPNNIAPGGLSGIGTMIHYLFGAPIGITIILCNIPIFIWGLYEVGYPFLLKTAAATLLSSLCIDFTASFMPAYHGDMLLVTIFSGLLAGVGLSLIFMRGATTGGTDLIAKLLKQHFRHISMGKILLGIDFAVVLSSAIVYRSYETPLYAVIVIFITSRVVDTVLYGTDSGTGKMMFIMSKKNPEIAQSIMSQIGRGVTVLKSRGGYSGEDGEVLMCAVWRQEVYKTYDIVYEVDENAFIVVGDAGEISGEGFKKIENGKKRKKRA